MTTWIPYVGQVSSFQESGPSFFTSHSGFKLTVHFRLIYNDTGLVEGKEVVEGDDSVDEVP